MSTTMHFGPEWMRMKHQPSRPQQSASPPPPVNAPTSTASSYSALVSAPPTVSPERHDETHPFRYSKEELLRIYKEGGGKGGLGLEVERWDGVVREIGSEPVGLRDLGEAEKKLFSGPLNSDLRRRQSTDYSSTLATGSSTTERPRLSQNSTVAGTGSPLRERFGGLKRRDSTDSPGIIIPRKQSLSSLHSPSVPSPRDVGLPSPRTRVGYTPNFDGVFSGGDSWMARRRASESSSKSIRDSGGDYAGDDRTPIREEIEEDDDRALGDEQIRLQVTSSSGTSSIYPSIEIGEPETKISDNRNVNAISTFSDNSEGRVASIGPPPGLVDLANIEWSYKDPSGQVQGPFRADLMQKWYDDGYFALDLPMKRTHIDTHWILIKELAKQAGGQKIFLTPAVPEIPPGLARNGSPMTFGTSSDHDVFSAPYQPAPVRTLRSSTLDSYSNPSDSPSSSFGTGRFANSSPDPSVFTASYFTGDQMNGLASGFSGANDLSPFSGRRGVFDESLLDPSLARSPSYGNLAQARGSSLEAFGFNSNYSSMQTSWTPSLGNGMDVMNTGNRIAYTSFQGQQHYTIPGGQDGISADNGSTYSSEYRTLNDSGNQRVPVVDNSHGGLNQYSNYNSISTPNQYSHSPAEEFDAAPLFQHVSPAPETIFNQHAPTPSPLSYSPHTSQPNSQPASHNQTPWSMTEPSQPRLPGPFDDPHPTSTNAHIPQASPWGPTKQARPASQGLETAWNLSSAQTQMSEENLPNLGNLTIGNVGQHNLEQESLASESIVVSTEFPHPQTEIQPSEHLVEASDQFPTKAAAKARGKVSTHSSGNGIPPQNYIHSSPIAEATSVSTQKAPWAKEDEQKKTKLPSASVSLRDIQEAEEKRTEARKVAEREREKALRAAVPSIDNKEDLQPFTASWGLPTSQAGVRVAAVKDASSPPTPGIIAPVWTTAVKPTVTKRSMKEIQEEEERRKKAAVKETVAAAAARRVYPDTTVKPTPASLQGSAWTTVGPSGKTSTVISPVRTPVVASTSASSAGVPIVLSAPKTNGPSIGRNAISAIKSVASPPKTDDNPIAPSHDFLRWLSDSLKGLNSSVNVEEIMSMLLSFPMDPDQSTLEIISDLIYINSTTLDGRRFASEFVSKRKVDAATRKSVSGVGKAPAKPVSIADVVKATPKTPQPEWGFKVVNKKKKGTRI